MLISWNAVREFCSLGINTQNPVLVFCCKSFDDQNYIMRNCIPWFDPTVGEELSFVPDGSWNEDISIYHYEKQINIIIYDTNKWNIIDIAKRMTDEYGEHITEMRMYYIDKIGGENLV